jgi:hypothetical protein
MLKAVFIEAPILYYYDPIAKLRIETDASAFAISAIML